MAVPEALRAEPRPPPRMRCGGISPRPLAGWLTGLFNGTWTSSPRWRSGPGTSSTYWLIKTSSLRALVGKSTQMNDLDPGYCLMNAEETKLGPHYLASRSVTLTGMATDAPAA